MIANRHRLCACYLALVSALPWPALLTAVRPAPDEQRGTERAFVSTCDTGAFASALPSERKPVVKSERVWIDGAAAPVVVQTTFLGAQAPLTRNENASQPLRGANPTCVYLCRLLV